MYRVVGALRRSHASQVISRDYSLARGLIESFKIGAEYDSNNAANNVVQSKLPTHSPVNKDVEHKQHGFGKDQKRYDGTNNQDQRTNNELLSKPVTRKISADEKREFLINTLSDLKDSKESVYVTLDAWVASEPTFSLASLREALVILEKHKQWHRIVQVWVSYPVDDCLKFHKRQSSECRLQTKADLGCPLTLYNNSQNHIYCQSDIEFVIEWILSKGQGNTMGTYELLIKALEKENRAEDAHRIWETKIGHNLRYVPWPFCDLMLPIYHRNNMLDWLLFRCLESCGRRPPRKSIIRKVADAYEMLGLSEEKDKSLTDYSYLFGKSKENKRKYNKSKEAKKGGNLITEDQIV